MKSALICIIIIAIIGLLFVSVGKIKDVLEGGKVNKQKQRKLIENHIPEIMIATINRHFAGEMMESVKVVNNLANKCLNYIYDEKKLTCKQIKDKQYAEFDYSININKATIKKVDEFGFGTYLLSCDINFQNTQHKDITFNITAPKNMNQVVPSHPIIVTYREGDNIEIYSIYATIIDGELRIQSVRQVKLDE